MNALSNRVALVTGGSRGIGSAIAIALGQAGADVAINYRQQTASAHEICEKISALGRRTTSVKADVSVAAEVTRAVEEVESRLGPIDILVNNAGIALPRKLEDITEQEWDDVIAVNLKSVFLLTKAVAVGMRRRQWGRIINMSSIAAQFGGTVGPHYAASKAGIVGLTHSCAVAWVREGITVNAIAPALIETEMVTRDIKASPDLIPMGRFGRAEDVASIAVMLATNDYMTGQTVSVNGGWYMTS